MTKIKYILMSILIVSGMFLTTPAHAVLKHTCHCANGESIQVPVTDISQSYCDGPDDSFGNNCSISEGCQTKCEEAGYGTSASDPEPEDPIQPIVPTSGATEATNLPSLSYFDVIENSCTEGELNFTFVPKGNTSFALHINLKNEAGKDILSAWCTGDESICKVVGNGQTCSGTDYTAANAWCYKAQ